MRILVCSTHAPLPPLNGYRLQLIHLCRELGRGHEVCVVAFRGPEQEGESPPGVELLTIARPELSEAGRALVYAGDLLAGRPFRVGRFETAMRGQVEALLADRDFDVAHVTPGSLAGVSRSLGGMPAVLASIDAWHLNVAARRLVASAPMRPLYRVEEQRVRRFGGHAYRAFDRVVAVSREDARATAELAPGIGVEAIPNGVDGDYWGPDASTPREAGMVVFTGTMSWPANVSAAQELALEVLPRVRSVMPGVRLSLVGRAPGADVLELGAIEGVEVTGEVADVRPWLRRAQVVACPMVSGTGIKNKLLEALACGAACVVTPLACQGLEVRADRELLIVEGADEIAAAIVRLLRDPTLRDRLGAAGREYVIDHHGWGSAARAYERVYAQAIAAKRGDLPDGLQSRSSPRSTLFRALNAPPGGDREHRGPERQQDPQSRDRRTREEDQRRECAGGGDDDRTREVGQGALAERLEAPDRDGGRP